MFLAHAGCNWAAFKPHDKVVAVVGHEELTLDMVALRAKALRGGRNAAADAQPIALGQLVQGYLAMQILEQYGAKVSDEAARVFWSEQQLPESARAVTVGTSDRLFLRAIARPDLATWLLDIMFERQPEFQQKERELAVRLHTDLLATPDAFDMLAVREGLEVSRHWIGPESIRLARPPANGAAAAPFTPDDIREAGQLYRELAGVKEGELYPALLNTPGAFQIFKVERRKPNELLLAAISIAKPRFEAWFLAQAAGFDVELRDPELGKQFLKAVPWGRRISVKNADDFPEFFFPAAK